MALPLSSVLQLKGKTLSLQSSSSFQSNLDVEEVLGCPVGMPAELTTSNSSPLCSEMPLSDTPLE